LHCSSAYQYGANWVHPPFVPDGEQRRDQADRVCDHVEEMVLGVGPHDLVLEGSAVEHEEELHDRNRGHAADHPELLLELEIRVLLIGSSHRQPSQK
jgi:hypothetical protein